MIDLILKIYYKYLSWYYFKNSVFVLGRFNISNLNNVRFGQNCAINHGVFILGRNNISIGDNVILSANCMLIDSGFDAHVYHSSEFPVYSYIDSHIIIEDNVWLGAGCIVLPGVTIGRNSIVAAGAIVTKNVPSFSIVAGNPARVVRMANE